MEGFIINLKFKYANCPDVIMRENVNMPLCYYYDDDPDFDYTWSFLEEALQLNDIYIVIMLLKLQPNITFYELYSAERPIILSMLLEAGADPNSVSVVDMQHIINNPKSVLHDWFFKMLMDYGADASSLGTFHTQHHFDYSRLVSSRVTSSRKALAALMILRKEAFFRAVRDVFNAVAREMWAQKGPAGCGPRVKLWGRGEEEK